MQRIISSMCEMFLRWVRNETIAEGLMSKGVCKIGRERYSASIVLRAHANIQHSMNISGVVNRQLQMHTTLWYSFVLERKSLTK